MKRRKRRGVRNGKRKERWNRKREPTKGNGAGREWKGIWETLGVVGKGKGYGKRGGAYGWLVDKPTEEHYGWTN